MAYKAQGKIEKIFDTEQKTASFQAREFVIQVEDGQYPQMVKFQLVQDKCSLVDDFKEGDEVAVDFDLRGREWNGKYFTNLQAWRVEKSGEQTQEASAHPTAEKSQTHAGSSTTTSSDDFDDDIPF